MERNPYTVTSLAPPDWKAELIVIGCSTGGPLALQKVLQGLKPTMQAPVVIAQHMPRGFTKSFAERLNTKCSLKVVEGSRGMNLKPGTVYVAPAGFLSRIQRIGQTTIVLDVEEVDPKAWLYRPSVDVLFASAAHAIGHQVLAVVMTGMGSDGVSGAKAVKAQGGHVVTESEQTAVIYGMPRAVYESGSSDAHLPVEDIPEAINGYAI